jgi:hypothetical protein
LQDFVVPHFVVAAFRDCINTSIVIPPKARILEDVSGVSPTQSGNRVPSHMKHCHNPFGVGIIIARIPQGS